MSKHMVRPRKRSAEKVYDRISRDLTINSRVTIAIVDDPYASLGEKITVVRSVRDDPLAGMFAREQINEIQYLAGRKWQEYAEQCEIGSIQAIDPTKESVDCKRMREPITDRQIKAFKKISEANRALNHEGARLVIDILGRRVSIRRAAESRGLFTKWGFEKTGREFRGCLDILSALWGFLTKT